jgi:hypothetical protein
MADDTTAPAVDASLQREVQRTAAVVAATMKPCHLPTVGTIVTEAGKPREVKIFETALENPYKQYAGYILEAALSYGVPAVLLWAIMARESGGQAAAINGLKGGAQSKSANSPEWIPGEDHGLMQISYKYHKDWFAVNRDESLGPSEYVMQPFMSPRLNIQKGASILRDCFKAFARQEPASKKYTQILPLSGELLLYAAIAAYNAGPTTVLKALRVNLSTASAEAVTYPAKNNGVYVPTIIQNATQLKFKLAQLDLSAGEAQSIAGLTFSPKSDGSATTQAAVQLFAQSEAQRRSERMATSGREVYAQENQKVRLRQNAVARLKRQEIPQGIAATSVKPVPFVQDANFNAMTYDWTKGIWGDGKPV